MRTWIYTYQDSDGHRHEGEMGADCKDSVYAELRKRGIRAVRVTERIVPIERRGFRGLRRRDWLLVALVVLVIVGGLWGGPQLLPSIQRQDVASARRDRGLRSRGVIESPPVELKIGDRVARPRPRKQVMGLPGTEHEYEDLISKIFKYRAECWLARFAIPAKPVPVGDDGAFESDLIDALDEDIVIRQSDAQAIVDLKRIVAGMKDEVAELLASGIEQEQVKARLIQRQIMECDYRKGVVRSVSEGGNMAHANESLRSLGMAPIGETER